MATVTCGLVRQRRMTECKCGLSPVVLGQRPNEAQTVINTHTLSSKTFSKPLDLSMPPGGKCSRSQRNPITVRSVGPFFSFRFFLFFFFFFQHSQTLETTVNLPKSTFLFKYRFHSRFFAVSRCILYIWYCIYIHMSFYCTEKSWRVRASQSTILC